jgi:hypothetical protein
MLPEIFSKWSERDRQEFDDKCRIQAEANVKKMKEFGLWKYASPKEKNFLQSFGSRMDEYAHRAACWRMECAGILMWALGLLDRWPKIDEEMNSDLLKSIPIEKVGALSKHPNLVPQFEISSKRDLIEFWHWRVRTRRLIEEGDSFQPDEKMKKPELNSYEDIVRFSAKAGHQKGDLPEIMDEDFVFLGKPFRELAPDEYHMATSIIMERHFALNWLCGMAPGNKWDDTPTDT